MAAELSFRHTATGSTMKATIRKPLTTGGKIQMCVTATGAFEDLTVANWATYIITMTETPASSYGYVGTWPAGLTTVGWYIVDFYDGATIAGTLAGTLLGYWDGTNFVLGGADTRQRAGLGISVAATTGNWATAGTWAGGVVPAVGDAIIVRNGVTVTIAVDLDLAQFGELELQGTGDIEISALITVATVPAEWTIAVNSGTITTNYGTVTNNAGTVTTNNGTVTENNSVVTTNNGTVASNNDTLTNNSFGGTVAINSSSGTITDNIPGGTVITNLGTVTNNTGIVNVVQTGSAAAIAALTTTVASASSTTVFVLTAGSAVASAYNGMLIALTDATDAHTEVRRIVSYAVTTKTVTVDRAFAFTPASPDVAVIMKTGYADANVTHIAGTATAVPGAAGGLLISGSNDGTTTLGALTVTGALSTGAVTLASAAITGALSVGTTTTLTGAVSLGSTLGITGAVTLSSTLATGAATFASAAITGAFSVGTTTTLTGAVSAPAGIAANITGNLIGTVSFLTTYTGNTVQSGDSYAIVNGAHGLVSIQDDLDILTGGGGATSDTIVVTDATATPLDGVGVWINSDLAGADSGTRVAGVKYTNASGEVTFQLNDGTYWIHCELSGQDFTTSYPMELTVSGGSFSV
jgi:hypothetical protein